MQIMLSCCIHNCLYHHSNANQCVCYHLKEVLYYHFHKNPRGNSLYQADRYMLSGRALLGIRNERCENYTFRYVLISGMNNDNTDSQKLNKIIAEIQALQEVVARFRQLRLDATEFACLKCIVTFKAGTLLMV